MYTSVNRSPANVSVTTIGVSARFTSAQYVHTLAASSFVSCDAGSPGRVRCAYTLESDVTVALGVGPYDASFLFEISDGLIRQVNHTRSQNTGDFGNYVTDVLNQGFGR